MFPNIRSIVPLSSSIQCCQLKSEGCPTIFLCTRPVSFLKILDSLALIFQNFMQMFPVQIYFQSLCLPCFPSVQRKFPTIIYLLTSFPPISVLSSSGTPIRFHSRAPRFHLTFSIIFSTTFSFCSECYYSSYVSSSMRIGIVPFVVQVSIFFSFSSFFPFCPTLLVHIFSSYSLHFPTSGLYKVSFTQSVPSHNLRLSQMLLLP